MMIDALDGEDGAFAPRLRDGAGASAEAPLPEVAEAPSESDDFEGRRNWAALLTVAAVLAAAAGVAGGVFYWVYR
jgi:hypothetical protein